MLRSPYIFILFITLSFAGRSQLNYDTLNSKLGKEKNPRKKLELFVKHTTGVPLNINDYDNLAKQISVIGKETKKEAYAQVVISAIYFAHNNFDKAMEYANRALGKAEAEKDTIALGYANLKIANCFDEQKNFEKCVQYNRLAAMYFKKLPVDHPYSRLKEVYNNLGSLFKDHKLLDSALYYHQKTLDIAIKTKDRKQQAYSFNNIGLVYNKMNKLDKALEYYEMSAYIKKELKDYHSLCGTLINKANLLKRSGKFEEALKNYAEGIKMAEEYKRGNFLLTGVHDLADVQIQLKDYKSAALNFAKYYHLFDSINKDKETKKLEEIAAKYETEKKDAEILKGRADIKSQQTIIKKQKQFNYAVIGGLILAFISIGVVYRSYRQNKKFAKNLAQQKNLIEVKNKEITDSINYAKRIQESLLTSEQVFKENSSEFFILFKPKDIVSGDFYWANKSDEGFLVMCGDCTGHGVPGAFMSLLGISYLNEIVQQNKVSRPNLIFNDLKNKIITNLNQKDEARKDGMDATLIKLNGLKLEFACSHNPIWIIRDNKIIKFKADKHPIGMGINDEFSFTHYTENLQKGDTVYMFTDGYADQFGGPNGKKFKVKQLEEKMLDIAPLNMADQKIKLDDHFSQWKGNLDQVDDVLVIGIRV